MSEDATCEVCAARPAYDAMTAWLCASCIECQASMAPDVCEWRGKQLPRGSQERRAMLTIANWQRQVFTRPRSRR